MSTHDVWELASFVSLTIGLPMGMLAFLWEQSKARDNEEEQQFQLLSNAYTDFLKVVLANPDLHLRTTAALQDPTPEQRECRAIIFDMLISLFERAYLVAYKPRMTDAERRRWNSWNDWMVEWARREDFRAAAPLLLLGEDPEFKRYLQRILDQETQALSRSQSGSTTGLQEAR